MGDAHLTKTTKMIKERARTTATATETATTTKNKTTNTQKPSSSFVFTSSSDRIIKESKKSDGYNKPFDVQKSAQVHRLYRFQFSKKKLQFSGCFFYY